MSKKRYYSKISDTVVDSLAFKDLPLTTQMLYVRLCRLRSEYRDHLMDDSFWRTDLQLIRDTGFSRNALKSARNQLVERGYLVWMSHLDFNEGKSRGPRYYVLDDIYKNKKDKDALSQNGNNPLLDSQEWW